MIKTQISKTKFKTVEEYLSSFPKHTRNILEAMRAIILKAAPKAEELISYNMPSYKLNGFLVSFAAWKKHIGLYPIPAGDETFKKKISIYKEEKSTAQFPYDKPLPVKLITRLVKLRIKENKERLRSKNMN
jgi:uncharacterized protein YdhG (YjbR/CyaY superfamily)